MKIKITKTTFEDGTVLYYADMWTPFMKVVKEEEFEVEVPE